MAGLTVSVAPTAEPVTRAEAKTFLRIDHSNDDTLIDQLVQASREFVEEYTGRAIMSQTLVLTLDAFDELADPLWEGTKTGPYKNYYKNYVTLAKAPVRSVTTVKTYDDDDTATTMASTKYYVDITREPARVVLRTGETFPTALRVANAIEVTYVAGYASSGAVPQAIKTAILQYVSYLYEHRGDMYEAKASVPSSLGKILQPYVVFKGQGSSVYSAIG
tara:strand:- start:11279 stop:11935 length:657 start_codon:yes stop_codon:yes gene_type:complete